MANVGIHETKTTLSKLLRRVSAGEEIIITRSGEPVAKLVPAASAKRRRLGVDTGRYEVPFDFDEPLPEDLVSAFES